MTIGEARSIAARLRMVEARLHEQPKASTDELETSLGSLWSESPPHLLWIDDDPAWFSAMQPFLERCGFKVTAVSDPTAFIENPSMVVAFDAILLDIIQERFVGAVAAALQAESLDGPNFLKAEETGI